MTDDTFVEVAFIDGRKTRVKVSNLKSIAKKSSVTIDVEESNG